MKISKVAAFLLTGALVLPLVGCSAKDPAYLSGINASDYVDVADYSNITVEEAAPSVSDDYVESYINYQLSQNTTTEEVTDRTDVEEGDIVNIDYTGTKDGVAFDGGSATGYDLTIGSGSFIDGFEDGLIGHHVGETVDLDLTFPEDYSNTDLAGQAVVFTVTINSISQQVTPELTDEWVASQNITGVTTADQYRTYVKNQLMQSAQNTYDQDVQNQIIDYLLDNSTYKQDPPEEMISRYFDLYETYMTQVASQYGIDLDTYASLTGIASTEDTASTEDSASTEDTETAAAEETAADTTDTEASDTEDTEAAQAGSSDDTAQEAESASTDETDAAAAEDTEEGTTASTEAVTEDASADGSDADTASTESSTAASTEEDTMNDATRAGIRDLAIRQAKILITLGAIADKEGMSIREREYESAVATRAASLGYTGLDDFEEGEDEEAFKEQLLENKVLEFLQSKATVNEPADESSTESTTEAADESSTESTTEAADESSTESTTETADESSTESTTEAADESSTESTTEATAEAAAESTTAAADETTAAGTTEAADETTTEAAAATTAASETAAE